MNSWIIALLVVIGISVAINVKKNYGNRIWEVWVGIQTLLIGLLIGYLLSLGADYHFFGGIMDIASKVIYITTIIAFVKYYINKGMTWVLLLTLVLCLVFYKNVLTFFGF